jgi:hypothetical protein
MDADRLSAKIKLGFAACQLAPDQIDKIPIQLVRQTMDALRTAHIACPAVVWLHLVWKTACEHVEHERFDMFVQTFRPWRMPSDSKDRVVDWSLFMSFPHPRLVDRIYSSCFRSGSISNGTCSGRVFDVR